MSGPALLLPDDTDAPRLTRAVQWLIAINVAIYFLQLTVVGSQNMELALGFQARDLGRSWWSVVTYMFVHANAWHLAGNMYVLYLFGPRIEHKWSAGEFTRFYILCGLGGWFAHLLFARGSLIVGASAAVYGVALAYARQWPDDEIQLFGVFPIKVKWLVALYIATDIVGGLADRGATGLSGGTAHLAHLGGLAAGWLYLRTSSVTTIERLRQRVSPVADISDEPPRAVPRSIPRNRDGGNTREKVGEVDDIVAKSKAATARRPTLAQVPPKAQPHKRAADLDMVLDKISEQGLDSLTLEERMLLEEASKKLRSDR
jgi:membrane associated rhomboid family serine protease